MSIARIRALNYGIDNRQACTRKPFLVNFPHNCSRTRLIQDVNVPNTDQLLYISLIFSNNVSSKSSLTVLKSSSYRQQIHFTFTTTLQRDIILNNSSQVVTVNSSISRSYMYDSSNELFTPLKTYDVQSNAPPERYFCKLKYDEFKPSEPVSRIYYLFTDEANLQLDLTASSNQISPVFDGFDRCFEVRTSLSALGIALIVIVSVLGLITTVLILICLNRQVRQFYHIWKNWMRERLGLTPVVQIYATPSSWYLGLQWTSLRSHERNRISFNKNSSRAWNERL